MARLDPPSIDLISKSQLDDKRTSDIKPKVKKRFVKRNVIENHTVEVPYKRGFRKIEAKVVPKGKEPYEWTIAIPNDAKSKDLSKKAKIIVTEKSEVEKTIKKLNTDYYIHNLGGNPFGSVQRTSVQDNPDGVRRSKKTIVFRQDAAFSTFYYPEVAKNAEVIIVADEDYIGQYLSENLAHTLPTKNITIYNIESTSPELLAEVLAGKHPEYKHDVNKAIAGAWYIESQSEIGASLTSALTGVNSVLDNFTKQQRKGKKWSTYKRAYLQGITNLNISDQELAVMGKILQEEINQESRIIATIETDIGLQTVEATAQPTTKEVDALFHAIDTRDLNIKNTDQTTMILMSDLGIESMQAEELIKRLSSQGIVSYPRTEYEGISPKEDINPEQLADIWVSYLPEYQNEKENIVQGIKRIQQQTAELPRSGIIVLNYSDFKENTIERQTIESVAKANIWASLGYFEIKGELRIVDQNNKEIGYKEVTVLTKDPRSIGKVIDVQVERKQGMSDKEMFRYLSSKELGTTSTRTNLIKRLEKWGFLLKSPSGEYKLDDRGKMMTLAIKEVDPSLTSGEFSNWLKDKRNQVENNPEMYNQRKMALYNRLAIIIKDLNDKQVFDRAESNFHRVSKQIQSATFLKQDLQDDTVQINVGK